MVNSKFYLFSPLPFLLIHYSQEKKNLRKPSIESTFQNKEQKKNQFDPPSCSLFDDKTKATEYTLNWREKKIQFKSFILFLFSPTVLFLHFIYLFDDFVQRQISNHRSVH